MTTVADLLPSSSSPVERALAAAMTDDLPVEIVAAVDPATAPVALLPWLAVHDGVRLWYSDWPEALKRRVIAESLVANFEVGTRAGAIRFLAYVGADLIDVSAYPVDAFLDEGFCDLMVVDVPAFYAAYLVEPHATARAGDLHLDRDLLDEGFLSGDRDEVIERVFTALRVAKAPETEVVVDFATRRPPRAGDALLAGTAPLSGAYLPRHHLVEDVR